MSLFMLDTAGDQKLHDQISSENVAVTRKAKFKPLDEKISSKVLHAVKENETDDSEDDGDYFGLPPPNIDLTELIDETLLKTAVTNCKTTQALNDVGVAIDAALENAQPRKKSHRKRIVELDHSDFNVQTGKFDDEQLFKVNTTDLVAQSTMAPGFEQLSALPRPSGRKQRELNRIERAKTKGGEWYNLPATELTEEVENELKILQMRSVLDPKHFYKKNDLKVLPKYFQIGTVQHSPLDYYSERESRKNKKRTLVDELLADTAFQTFNKRKYNEIMARRNKYAQRKTMKKMKKLKKHK